MFCGSGELRARRVTVFLKLRSTHLPALAALDFHQVFRIADDVGHHIDVVLEGEYHRSGVGR